MVWNTSLFKSWLIQINKEKNPEITCIIPAAFLFVPKKPHPSPTALTKKKTKAVMHCKIYKRFVLAAANRITKEITTIEE